MFSFLKGLLSGKRTAAPSSTKVRQSSASISDAKTGKGSSPSRAVQPVPSRHQKAASAPQRSRAQGNNARETTAKEIKDVLNFAGRVLTAPGETLELTESQRKVVAILENGVMVATKADRLDNNVLAAEELANRQGVRIRSKVYVDLDVIRKVYDKAIRRTQQSGRSQKDVTKMEKEFLELVREAADEHASDIYVQIERFETLILFRSLGVVRPVRQIRSDYAQDMLRAAFAMAKESDPSYLPTEIQSARIADDKTALPPGVQSLRLQFTPLSGDGTARYLVARLLYYQEHIEGSDVDMLGYSTEQVRQIKEMRDKPFGINVMSGPTGSGKSTTLQLTLSAQMEEKNHRIRIMTIEDPPEYQILGAAQVPILNAHTAEQRKAAFSKAIGSALRSAPDIIMVGEIRDEESATLAFEASMTGHQVWTTVHSNTAISIIDRFRDWDVEDFKLTDETLVTGLIGQRLVRTLCPKCRIPYEAAKDKKTRRGRPLVDESKASVYADKFGEEALKSFHYVNENGCDDEKCRDGYIGRTVVAECIQPDATFMEFVKKDNKREAINHWLTELNGFVMLEHGAAKVLAGIVDPRDAEGKIGSFAALDKARLPLVRSLADELVN